jgi:hypothetical protein
VRISHSCSGIIGIPIIRQYLGERLPHLQMFPVARPFGGEQGEGEEKRYSCDRNILPFRPFSDSRDRYSIQGLKEPWIDMERPAAPGQPLIREIEIFHEEDWGRTAEEGPVAFPPLLAMGRG